MAVVTSRRQFLAGGGSTLVALKYGAVAAQELETIGIPSQDGTGFQPAVTELMRDIVLPPELELSQGHGKVSWSVRATWEIIAGWYYYDTIANLYHVPPTAINDDIVDMVGGPDQLADRARRHLRKGRPLEAIRLLDIAADDPSRAVLETRIEAVERLLRSAREGLGNYSEIGLLEADLRASRLQLEGLD